MRWITPEPLVPRQEDRRLGERDWSWLLFRQKCFQQLDIWHHTKLGITLEYPAGEKMLCSQWLLATWLQYKYHG